jgi:hypothetical protein
VALKRLAVVDCIVAKHRAAGVKLVPVSNQDIQIVMADLVPEMP